MTGKPRGFRGNRYQDEESPALSGVDYPQQKGSPDQRSVIDLHLNDDVDSSWSAHHHTLGSSPGQASEATHDHDGVNSPVVTATYPYYFRGTAAAISVPNGTLNAFVAINMVSLSAESVNASAGDLVAGAFVVPFDALWLVRISADCANNATGVRGIGILIDGTTLAGGSRDVRMPITGMNTYLQTERSMSLGKGTSIKVGVFHTAGANLVMTLILEATCINRMAL